MNIQSSEHILLTGAGIALMARVFLDLLRQDYALEELNLPRDS